MLDLDTEKETDTEKDTEMERVGDIRQDGDIMGDLDLEREKEHSIIILEGYLFRGVDRIPSHEDYQVKLEAIVRGLEIYEEDFFFYSPIDRKGFGDGRGTSNEGRGGFFPSLEMNTMLGPQFCVRLGGDGRGSSKGQGNGYGNGDVDEIWMRI